MLEIFLKQFVFYAVYYNIHKYDRKTLSLGFFEKYKERFAEVN